MPRPLVLSNGSFLVGIDPHYAIRDLFYPQVGRWNHLSGHAIRVGVWVRLLPPSDNGRPADEPARFDWIDSPEWSHSFRYKPASLIAESVLENQSLGIRIKTTEGVSHRENWFARVLEVSNLSSRAAEVRVFFTHDLRIMESDIGDTAFFHPGMNGIVHYKGACWFLFTADSLYQYAAGLKGFKDFEGTWRDAEDGELSMNAIAQGSVDSTFSARLQLAASESKEIVYSIVAADDLEKLEASARELKEFGARNVLKETEEHWRDWAISPGQDRARRNVSHSKALPAHIQQLCDQSLLIMRAHIDNGGAIIAAIDSDIMETNRANYCYMWPRDGALISQVLDRAGQHHLPRAFFEFCARILPKHPPILRQKYSADGTLGATWLPWTVHGKAQTPFQEDETALVILGIWHHHQAFPDEDALRKHWTTFVQPTADFICSYRDDTTGLPAPSYDLWEERLGIHAYTVCTVIAGLRAAANIASHLDANKNADKYNEAAAGFNRAFLAHMVHLSGSFYRRVSVQDGAVIPDETVDSSLLHVGLLGILPIDDPRVVATAARVEEKLWSEGLGGLARYEGDYYFRRHDHLPGNPWIICTLWLAQHRIRSGDYEGALELIDWCSDRALASGVLPEQVDAVTGEHLSVSPLTWSHAEFLRTCYEYCDVT